MANVEKHKPIQQHLYSREYLWSHDLGTEMLEKSSKWSFVSHFLAKNKKTKWGKAFSVDLWV
jgi:hypothetical protein